MIEQRDAVTTDEGDEEYWDSPAKSPMILLLIAGCAAVLSVFLPWLSADTALGTITRMGTDIATGDALIVMALGGTVAVLEVINLSSDRYPTGWDGAIGISVALMLSGIWFWDYAQLNDRVGQITKVASANGSVGSGLWLLLLALILMAVGAIWQLTALDEAEQS